MGKGRVERRLVAILVVDVRGCLRMRAENEAGTLARLKTLRAELLQPKTAIYGARPADSFSHLDVVFSPNAI